MQVDPQYIGLAVFIAIVGIILWSKMHSQQQAAAPSPAQPSSPPATQAHVEELTSSMKNLTEKIQTASAPAVARVAQRQEDLHDKVDEAIKKLDDLHSKVDDSRKDRPAREGG